MSLKGLLILVKSTHSKVFFELILEDCVLEIDLLVSGVMICFILVVFCMFVVWHTAILYKWLGQ